MAVLIYAAMLWVALDLLRARVTTRAPARLGDARQAGLRRGAEAVLGLAFVTLVAGSFVAGTRAGYLYNTFPLMDGQLVPAGYWRLCALVSQLVRESGRGAVRSSRARRDDPGRDRRAVARWRGRWRSRRGARRALACAVRHGGCSRSGSASRPCCWWCRCRSRCCIRRGRSCLVTAALVARHVLRAAQAL